MKWKTCNCCGIEFPHSPAYFHRDSNNKCGLIGVCKSCKCEQVNSRYTPKERIIPKGFISLPYSDKHFVSKDGRIWSYKLGRLMKPHRHKDYGYLQLSINKVCKKVHQLVLEVFVDLCPEGQECCHNDGNPENNNIDNLRWDTRSENTKDAVKHGTHPVAKLTKDRVKSIKKMLLSGIKQSTIAKMYNVHQSTISYINTGKVWNYVYMDK